MIVANLQPLEVLNC